jgi:hypothetical protein
MTKSHYRIGVLALAAVLSAACEDISNPVEDFGQLKDPYVRFEFPDEIGIPGSVVPVIFVMTTRVEENVDIEYTFGGDAVYGTDYWAVDRDGNRRNDVTQAGGSARITYSASQTTFPRDTLRLFVPFSAADGRTAEIEIAEATTASGRAIETGFIEDYRVFDLNIQGFVDIPTGTYIGQRTGQLGTADANVTITKPATPVDVAGTNYSFVLSDYTGDGDVFGAQIPWAFNVTSGGFVLAAPHSHEFSQVTSNVTGTYNFTTRQLTLNTTLTCCGGAGLTWQLRVTRQ